jgi:hypothetical protein
MLRKIVLAGGIAVATVLSFQAGHGGGVRVKINAASAVPVAPTAPGKKQDCTPASCESFPMPCECCWWAC